MGSGNLDGLTWTGRGKEACAGRTVNVDLLTFASIHRPDVPLPASAPMEPVTEGQAQAPGEGLGHDGPADAAESRGGKEQADGRQQKQLKRPLKPLSQRRVKDYNEGLAKRGVVYLSRVPPFMKPAKVKHLMEQHGVVTRVREQRLPRGVESAGVTNLHLQTSKFSGSVLLCSLLPGAAFVWCGGGDTSKQDSVFNLSPPSSSRG